MTAEWDDLARLAEAATPGPWEFGNDWGVITSGSDSVIHGYYEGRCPDCGTEIEEDASVAVSVEDAEFIAAANPATILRLIEELRAEAKRPAIPPKLLMDYRVAKDQGNRQRARADELAARLAAVEALRDRWAVMAGTAIDPDTREWLDAASRDLRAALAAPTDTTKEN